MAEMNLGTARTQLMDDINKIVGDTEALLRAVAAVPGEKASALRASIEANLDAARRRLREMHGAAYDSTTAAARATDQFVHENPWALIGVAAAVGFILGLVLRRD